MSKVDVLVFAPHPDDAELFCAGTVLKLKKQGATVGIIDLTRGELSTRGTPELRAKEADKAGRILGLDMRTNAGLPDGNISTDTASKRVVISALRGYRPKIVLAPYWEDRHPDHINTSHLVSAAFFYSGLAKVKTEQEPYRPKSLIYYFQHKVTKPSFIVDISTEFKEKIAAIRAYKSQFYDPESKEPQTYISSPGFWESVETRAKYFGFQIGVAYGEPFYVKSALKIDNLMQIFT